MRADDDDDDGKGEIVDRITRVFILLTFDAICRREPEKSTSIMFRVPIVKTKRLDLMGGVAGSKSLFSTAPSARLRWDEGNNGVGIPWMNDLWLCSDMLALFCC